MLFAFLVVLAAQAEPQAVTVATYDYPRFDRRVALEPLAALVERDSGRPARIVLLPTPEALAKALCAGEVDVAMTNLGAFVQLRDCPGVAPAAVLDSPAEVLDGYRGVLLARQGTELTSLAAVGRRAKGIRYSEVLPGSTSGALVQADALRSVRIARASFAAVRQAGTHEAALEDLLAGRADLAALAEEPWRKLSAADPAKAAQLRLLWRSDPLPPGPVVCRERPALDCRSLRAALLGPAGEAVAPTLSAGWAETQGAVRFRGYDRADYRAFERE